MSDISTVFVTCDISGSHSECAEDSGLLGGDAVIGRVGVDVSNDFQG